MSVGSRLEGAALALAGVAVLVFLASAATGLRFSHGPDASQTPADTAAALTTPVGARVEVLNGAGRAGLARDATERLRAAGFDVVFFGNAREPRGLSLVLDRGGRGDAARRAAAALGIRDVRTQANAALYVDVTVILGKDWPPPPPPVRESWLTRATKAVRSFFASRPSDVPGDDEGGARSGE